MKRIYHIALLSDIERAGRVGEYIPPTFESDGFIHCSYGNQVKAVADAFFRGHEDLALVEIDPASVVSRIVDENLVGGKELYPHIYGSLPMSAVTSLRELVCQEDGSFKLPCNIDV
jgi:uncharacterized protein (DUF952 family)